MESEFVLGAQETRAYLARLGLERPERPTREALDDLVGFHSSAERGNTLRVSGAAPDEFHRFYGVSVKLDLDFAGAGPVRGVSYLVHVFSLSSAKASFLFVFVICFITA